MLKRALLGLVLSALLLLSLSAAVTGWLIWQPGHLDDALQAGFEEATGYRLTYEYAAPALSLRPAFTLTNLRISQPGTGAVLAEVDRARASLDVPALWDYHLRLPAVTLQGVRWNLTDEPLPDALSLPAPDGRQAAETWRVTVEHLAVEAAAFLLETDLTVQSTRLTGTGTFTWQQPAGDLPAGTTSQLAFSLTSTPPVGYRFEGSANTLGLRVELTGNTGRLPDFEGGRVELDLSGQLDGSLVRRADLPLAAAAPVELSVIAEVSEAEVEFAPVMLTLAGLEVSAEITTPIDDPGATEVSASYAIGDLAELGDLVGVAELPAEAFGGSFRYHVGTRAVSLTLENDRHQAELEGSLGEAHGLDGSRLAAVGRGTSASPWLEFLIGLELSGERSYEVGGPIQGSRQGLRFGPLETSIDGVALLLTVDYRYQGDDWLDVAATFADADLGRTLGMLEIPDVPAWSANGSFRYQALSELLSIDGRLAEFPSTRIRIETDVNAATDLANLQLRFNLDGPDVNLLFPEAFAVRTFPYQASGVLFRVDDGVRVDDATLEFGPTTIAGEGGVTLGGDYPAWLDFNTRGQSLADLGTLGAMVLPDLPYELDTRLGVRTETVEIERLIGSIAENDVDLTGSVRTTGVPEIVLSGQSNLLDLARLPWSAEVSDASKQDRLLSSQPFATDWLDAFRLELDYRVGTMRFEQLAVQDIDVQARIADGRLQVSRFEFQDDMGRFTGQGEVKRRPQEAAAIDLSLALQGHGIALENLTSAQAPAKVAPRYDLDVQLASHGASLAELAGRSNGTVLIQSDGGYIERLALDALTGDVLTEIFTRTVPEIDDPDLQEDFVRMDCLVARGHIEDGILHLQPGLTFRTSRANVFVFGEADIGQEQLDLSFASHARRGLGISAGTILNPYFKVGGSFLEPEVKLDPGSALGAMALTAITGGFSILFKGLGDRSRGEIDSCARFLEVEIEQR